MAQQISSNQNKPVIGITGNSQRFSPSWICLWLAITINGGKAIRISKQHRQTALQLNGLIVSGGDDIHPSFYGQEEAVNQEYDKQRDELEIQYIKQAIINKLPMLGICRGMQLINLVAGGTLYTDIRPLRKNTSNRRILLPRKTVDISTNSNLSRILAGKRLLVNSLHHQAIDKIAPGFTPAAQDLDHFVQAIEKTESTILGVQWHPEYLGYLPKQQRIFRWLVEQAKQSVKME